MRLVFKLERICISLVPLHLKSLAVRLLKLSTEKSKIMILKSLGSPWILDTSLR